MTELLLLSLWVLLAVRARTLLAYFQQEEYDSTRFPAAVWRMRLFDIVASLCAVIGFGLGHAFGLGTAAPVIVSLAFLLIAWREWRYKFKKPLVWTGRAQRLYGVTLALFAILSLLAILAAPLAILVIQAAPLVLMASGALLRSHEAGINDRYVQDARLKLAGFKGLRIGITGSFGKTTVKHVLGQVLAIDHTPFYSRGSINTVLGLTRHIRQRLQPAHTHFIAEMGAYRIGSIRRLCEFVRPDIGIVTAVGDAHRERFGGIENTAIAKAELAHWICEHGTLVVTTEAVLTHRPFADLRARFPEKFVVVGPGETADVRIFGSHLDGQARTISLRVDGKPYQVTTPLLAQYNESNIALVIALMSRIAPDSLTYLPEVLPHLEQTAHRLEIKNRVSAPLLLDDAYNSNETGFREAVEVLHALAGQRGGKAIMVTPGIVELGDAHEAVHRKLGELSGRLCDAVYVVNPDRIPSFIDGLRDGGAEVTMVQRFGEALADLNRRFAAKQNVVLYENDLPDVLEEKRVL